LEAAFGKFAVVDKHQYHAAICGDPAYVGYPAIRALQNDRHDAAEAVEPAVEACCPTEDGFEPSVGGAIRGAQSPSHNLEPAAGSYRRFGRFIAFDHLAVARDAQESGIDMVRGAV